MFKYTKASIGLVIDSIKKYAKIFKYGSLGFMSLYFIYSIIASEKNRIINIVLASLMVLYTIFEIFANKYELKKTKRIVKRSYKWVKLLTKAFTLGSSLYGMYTASETATPISIILATLMIILWVLQTLLEIVLEIAQSKLDLIMIAWKQDMEDIKKPVTAVSNVFKKITGQEVIKPVRENEKELAILEARIQEDKEKKGKK